MSYKLIKGKKGDRWMKDGKFVKASDVPEEFKQDPVNKEDLDKKCLICGGDNEHKRNVLGMMIALCDTDYYSVSYGFLAGILKKKGYVNGAH